VRVVGKPEVIQLDEKSPMLRLARPALQRLLPPGRQRAAYGHRHHREFAALSGSMPIRSLTAKRNFCLQPR
jgi:hypothetical protein